MMMDHINVGPRKPLSYLPLNTIENVLKMTLSEYRSLVQKAGNESVLLDTSCCCISSGAVYAFNEKYLNEVLAKNVELLTHLGWPLSSRDFIKRIATEWFDESHPIFPVIRESFGDI